MARRRSVKAAFRYPWTASLIKANIEQAAVRSRTKRKAKRRATRKGINPAVVPMSGRFVQAYPAYKHVTLKYSYYNNLAPTTTNVSYNQFRANSVYDPDLTGAGNQPRYFDQLCGASLYRKFRVMSMGYKVRFVNKNASGAASDALVGVYCSPVTTLPTTNAELFLLGEQNTAEVRPLLPLGQSNAEQVFTGQIQPWRVLNCSKEAYEYSSQTDGNYSANPTDTAYFSVMCSDDPNNAGGASVDVYVELYYNVCFYNLAQDVTQS